jgi:hypothetical protein
MGHRHEQNAQGAKPATEAGGFSRRTMVVGTVATAAVAAVSHLANPAYAQAPDPSSSQDIMAFLLLSEALTGVDRLLLAPELVENKSEILNSDPGIDPINIKNAYFQWINDHDSTSSFAKLLQVAKDKPQAIIDSVTASDDNVRFLARSIVLLWYLGSWYTPKDLQDQANALKPARIPPSKVEVVSPKAYTQGLVWQIAGAHPMGYSNLQFGYWSRDPRDVNDPKPLLAPPTGPLATPPRP